MISSRLIGYIKLRMRQKVISDSQTVYQAAIIGVSGVIGKEHQKVISNLAKALLDSLWPPIIIFLLQIRSPLHSQAVVSSKLLQHTVILAHSTEVLIFSLHRLICQIFTAES